MQMHLLTLEIGPWLRFTIPRKLNKMNPKQFIGNLDRVFLIIQQVLQPKTKLIKASDQSPIKEIRKIL